MLAVDEKADKSDERKANYTSAPREMSGVDEKCADADNKDREQEGEDQTCFLAEDVAFNDQAARLALMAVGFVTFPVFRFGHRDNAFGAAWESFVVGTEKMRGRKRALERCGDVGLIAFDSVDRIVLRMRS